MPGLAYRAACTDKGFGLCQHGLYKAETIYHLVPWKGIEDVEYATLEWVAWYNTQRLMEPLGHIPPTEYEEQYHRARANSLAPALN